MIVITNRKKKGNNISWSNEEFKELISWCYRVAGEDDFLVLHEDELDDGNDILDRCFNDKIEKVIVFQTDTKHNDEDEKFCGEHTISKKQKKLIEELFTSYKLYKTRMIINIMEKDIFCNGELYKHFG